MSMHNVYRQRLPRHKHNISERQYFDMNMGQLVPTYVKELYPGDTVKISSSTLLETRTLKAPLKNNIKYREYWFFVPRRLMWKNWEKFIFGGKDGNFTASFPYLTCPNDNQTTISSQLVRNSLYDYLGFPVFRTSSETNAQCKVILDKFLIDAMPFAAYQMIYKDWFRNENFSSDIWDFENNGNSWLQDGGNYGAVNGDTGNIVLDLTNLRNVPWSRTYFTGALPFRQRGNANRVPLHGVAPLHFYTEDSQGNITVGNKVLGHNGHISLTSSGESAGGAYYTKLDSNNAVSVYAGPGDSTSITVDGSSNDFKYAIQGVDLQGFTITELRLLAKLQEFEEINARFGFRYIEGLQGHFGVSPTDARLDRPEFIGGRSQDVIVSEILQTSETDIKPLGTPAGRGISGSGNRIAKYFAEEHGILMCVCSIMPEQIYSQGIDRQWTRRTKEEFFSPEFNGLSEQEVKEKEVFAVPSMTESQLNGVFGFVPAWEELRHGKTTVKGNLANPNASDLYAWTQARTFSSAPVLGENFLMANQSNSNGGIRTDAWITLNASCPFFVSCHFKVTKISTLSASGVPGITRI